MSDSRASTWSDEQLADIDDNWELEIAVRRGDGSLGRWTHVWAVVAARDVFVRTWRMRETGWYGGVVRTGRARIRVPGVEVEVRVERTGDASGVDVAYRMKYGEDGARPMVTAEAARSTLRLRPSAPHASPTS